ncbi:MAG: DUF1552 domain-containing protein [Myxococcales bacterium]|nr:MAG: DUF1552 domain-containing protein [Myxococcales bacterium]
MPDFLSSRRLFLAALGASAVTVRFAGMWQRKQAAAANGAPKRFIMIFNPQGVVMDQWKPRSSSGGAATETNFTLDFNNSILAPLQPYKDRLLVLDNVDHRVNADVGVDNHGPAMISAVTGAGATGNYSGNSGEFERPRLPSIDQYLAAQLNPDTPVKSLQLSAGFAGGTSAMDTLSYDMNLNRLPPLYDPIQTYDLLFGSFQPSGGGGTIDPALERKLARRGSALDYASADIERLRNQLPPSERDKLDQHLEALASIERRLDGSAVASCNEKPPAPASINATKRDNAPTVTELQFDIVAQAFACDMTRFVSMQFDRGGSFENVPWLGIADPHNNIAHAIPGGASGDSYNLEHYYAEKVAYLLEALDVPDPLGEGTILDNTLIYWTNEFGSGSSVHSHNNIPVVLAGGAGGALNTGRYLKMRDSSLDSNFWCMYANSGCSDGFYAHGKLFAAMMQAMGLSNVTSWVDPRLSNNSAHQGVETRILA